VQFEIFLIGGLMGSKLGDGNFISGSRLSVESCIMLLGGVPYEFSKG
jgi:hypothetical protein